MKRNRSVLKPVAVLLGLISAGQGALHLYRVRSAEGAALTGPKLLAEALSPFVTLAGAVGALLGLLIRSPLAFLTGAAGALLSGRYVKGVLQPPEGFERTFGEDWEARIPPERRERMLPSRWQPGLPEGPEPRWERDVVFWTLPAVEGEAERELLCDLWLPPEGIAPSGLAFIYLHGSGWHFIDKDVGTRPMFRHLAAQGHVIMDVAYRLCPEVQWQAMAGDPKRAIAWMKEHAAEFGVDPERIVIAGGSAGGHLALLAAYAPDHPELTPEDVRDADLGVRAVVSWYGPSDMRLYYDYAGVPFSVLVGEQDTDAGSQISEWVTERLGFEMQQPQGWCPDQTVQEAMMHGLLGGSPSDVPEAYALFSPVEHVDAGCPPTLLLQGEHDMIVSAEGVRTMAEKLEAAGVPVIYVEYPQTEHAFDLILPHISPPAQAALYEVERFLALL